MIVAPIRYAEVRVNGKKRLIEIVREDDTRVAGYRANRDGSRWDREDETTWTQELIIVSAKSVVRRLALDLTFGELVEIN